MIFFIIGIFIIIIMLIVALIFYIITHVQEKHIDKDFDLLKEKYGLELAVDKRRDKIKNRLITNNIYKEALILNIAIVVIFSIILLGVNIKYKPSMTELNRKSVIEYKLAIHDDQFETYLKKAEDYNKLVNAGNNIFWRFKVEDRSEYMINIDYYKENYNGKINKRSIKR